MLMRIGLGHANGSADRTASLSQLADGARGAGTAVVGVDLSSAWY